MIFRLLARTFAFWAALKRRIYSAIVTLFLAETGKGIRITPPFRFSNLNRVRFAKGVSLNANCWIAAFGDDHDQTIKVSIGANSGIGMGATILAARSVILEDHVLIARNVSIFDHVQTRQNRSVRLRSEAICDAAPVYIGQHTWLGQNVVVMPGVTIGRHCVVGANSVVMNSVPDYSVAVGSPARVVKRFDEATSSWKKAPKD